MNIINGNAMNLMAKALDAYTLRNSTIANNIANDDTPGYKRKDVKFEELLDKSCMALSNDRGIANRNIKSRIANQTGKGSITSNASSIDSIKPEIYEQQTDTKYRIDGNNVDIDNEMTELVKNQLRYSTVLSQVNKQFQMMRTAMRK